MSKMDHTGLFVYLLLLSAFLFMSCFSLGFENIHKSHKQKYSVENNPASENSDESVDAIDSTGSHQQDLCYEATSEGCHRGSVSDERSNGEDDPAATGLVGEAACGATGGIQWDERGYVTFCQRLGNFGNQMEIFLGMVAIAKALDRTLVIPHFTSITFRDGRVHASVPFSELFEITPMLEYHRVVTMEVFLTTLAPRYWPPGQRKGYIYQRPLKSDKDCNKAGCWSGLDPPVEFDECFLHKLSTFQTDIADEKSMIFTRDSWNSKFPVEEHPVFTLSSAKPAFPVNAGNRQIQKFVKWNEHFMTTARSYINDTFGSNTWVGLHLRNGGDWDMCLPRVAHMLELTLKVLKDVSARHLFIATDKHPYLEEFRKVLSPIGVSVHHLNPKTPQVDLVILGQADYFIGTCTSTFTSFVKRERDASGKPSIFWGQEYIGF